MNEPKPIEISQEVSMKYSEVMSDILDELEQQGLSQTEALGLVMHATAIAMSARLPEPTQFEYDFGALGRTFATIKDLDTLDEDLAHEDMERAQTVAPKPSKWRH